MQPADFADIRGQEHVKRALEVAAAGGHAALLTGGPGSGKTLLARALHGILPPPTDAERREVEDLHDLAGQPAPAGRPLVAPAHHLSLAGLLGSATRRPRPGALSLAHRGVLLLDGLPEFGRRLEPLARALADGALTLRGAAGDVRFPAEALLVASQWPCPCGWDGDPERACACSPALVARYQRRVPPALLSQVAIFVEVPRLAYERLSSSRLGEPSAAVRARVAAARDRQAQRLGAGRSNAAMTPAEIRAHCALDGAGQSLMKAAVRQLGLSARGYHRVLLVARSIADLAGAEQIGAAHLAESVQYRPRGCD